MPDDIASLPVKQQMKRVVLRSMWMMGLGTAMVLVFSDPMVDHLWGSGFVPVFGERAAR